MNGLISFGVYKIFPSGKTNLAGIISSIGPGTGGGGGTIIAGPISVIFSTGLYKIGLCCLTIIGYTYPILLANIQNCILQF